MSSQASHSIRWYSTWKLFGNVSFYRTFVVSVVRCFTENKTKKKEAIYNDDFTLLIAAVQGFICYGPNITLSHTADFQNWIFFFFIIIIHVRCTSV